MKFSEQLLKDIGNVRSTFPMVDLTERGPFMRNLVLMFHVIRASEHLLETAICASLDDKLLLPYFSSHLEEERDHQSWLAGDIASAGVDVRKTIIPVNVVEMVGTQYFLIHHLDPSALLGYMAVLECFPMPREHIDALVAAHGPELMNTVRFHAEHDIDHGSDLLDVIDQLPPHRQTIVRQSALQSSVYLRAAIAANV